jgi:hypothetical protein
MKNFETKGIFGKHCNIEYSISMIADDKNSSSAVSYKFSHEMRDQDG